MRFLKQRAAKVLLVFLATNPVRAGTNDFQWQLITLPVNVSASHFADVDNDGRSDLLAIDPVAKKLLIYRQRASGFAHAPDQVIGLPPHTAWIAPFDVDAHPGLELLMSTATGLAYCRQNGGMFESELRTLVQAGQVFTNDDSPGLISLATNAAIPVISATQAVLYRRNDAFEWSHGEPVALAAKRNSWSGAHNGWTVGPYSSRTLRIQQSLQSKPDDAAEQIARNPKEPKYKRAADEKPENDAIGKLIEDMKKAGPRHQPGIDRVDLDGDGREDLVLWQVLGDNKMDFRTDVHVFLRGADDKLPERPTQVLHCRGFPIPFGSTQKVSPMGDLKGDGKYELVLLELSSLAMSASGLVDMVLTHGLDWKLAIRPFKVGGFSRSPDAAIAITAIMSVADLEEWPFFICGDFNGDGRPDLVVQRSTTQWNILFSTDDGHWFTPQPAMTFETPMQGYFEINAPNGNGRSDIVLRAYDNPRIFIFQTQPPQTKGNP
jgi:hypothetical protein